MGSVCAAFPLYHGGTGPKTWDGRRHSFDAEHRRRVGL